MLLAALIALISFGFVIFIFYAFKPARERKKEAFVPFVLENLYVIIALGAMAGVFSSMALSGLGGLNLVPETSGILDIAFGPAGFVIVILSAIAAWFLKRKSRIK